MMKSALAKVGLLSVATAGILLAAPEIANAAPVSQYAASVVRPAGATGEIFGTYDECEAEANIVRDGTTGAWCEPFGIAEWELYVSGS